MFLRCTTGAVLLFRSFMQLLMQYPRKYWISIVPSRLSFIYDSIIRNDSHDSIIRNLQDDSLASIHYDSSCLAIDRWYLFDRGTVYPRRSPRVVQIEDPISRVMLGILSQAISDARTKRPCDWRSWRRDIPPGSGCNCTASEHICALEAIRFLREVAPLWEQCLDISPGMLVNLLTKKNGSVIGSRSEFNRDYLEF